MRHRFVAHFSSSRAACFTLCCEMLAIVANSHHSILASSGASASFSRVAKPVFLGWGGGCGGGGGIIKLVEFSYSYGVPVLSKVFLRKEASSDMVLICHAGQHFRHAGLQRTHHFALVRDHRNIREVNDTILRSYKRTVQKMVSIIPTRDHCMARSITNKHVPALWQHNKTPSKT